MDRVLSIDGRRLRVNWRRHLKGRGASRNVVAGRSALAGQSKTRNVFVIMGLVVIEQFLLVHCDGDILHTGALPLGMGIRLLFLGSTAVVMGGMSRVFFKGSSWQGRVA